MPNDLRRSFSALFSRGGKDRASERKLRDELAPRRGKSEKTISIKTSSNQPPIVFNDDYVDPLDIVPRTEVRVEGTYDEPWDSSNRLNSSQPPPPPISTIPNQSYDVPWDSSLAETPRANPPMMTYDEPWDRTVIDPHFVAEAEKQKSTHPADITPHRRARSLVPKLNLPQKDSLRPVMSIIRPARSHDSLATPNGSQLNFSDIPKVPPTPGIAESPLNFHKRQSSQPTEAIGSSAYLQQLLRQGDGKETTSLDDLLYGPTKHFHRRVDDQYDEPWSRATEHIYPPPQLSQNHNGFHPQHMSQQPARSRSAKSQIRKNHSLSPHRPIMTTSTMIKGLQVENSIYNRESTKGENSSSTGRSTCSDKSQSPSNISSKNQVEILDQMDYYRSAMTRSEAEKILRDEAEGSFVVRRNTQNPGWYSLSVVTIDQGVLHLLILDSNTDCRTGGVNTSGWHVGGSGPNSAEFPSVPELIQYYQTQCLNIRGTKGLRLMSKNRI